MFLLQFNPALVSDETGKGKDFKKSINSMESLKKALADRSSGRLDSTNSGDLGTLDENDEKDNNGTNGDLDDDDEELVNATKKIQSKFREFLRRKSSATPIDDIKLKNGHENGHTNGHENDSGNKLYLA